MVLSWCKELTDASIELLCSNWSDSLESIDITANEMTERALECILTQCPKLQELSASVSANFNGQSFSKMIPAIANGLRSLNVQQTRVGSKTIQMVVKKCKSLQLLDIAGCEMDDKFKFDPKLQVKQGIENYIMMKPESELPFFVLPD